MTPFMGVSGLGGAGSLIGTGLASILSKNYWQTKIVGSANGADYNGYTVAVDSESGAVFFGGGGRAFGTGTTDTIFIGKLNADGSHAWGRALKSDSSGSEGLYGMDCDSQGNVYAVGYCTNSSSLYTNGGTDIIIAKWNTDGVLQWQRTFGDSSVGRAREIHIDDSDNIFICGQNASRVHVVKYNTSGTVQWQTQITDNVRDHYGYGIDTDGSGNIYACAHYHHPTRKSTLYKLNSSGTVQWARLLENGSSDLFANHCATDSSGNVYVCAYGAGGSFSYDWRILKFNSSGTLQWQEALAGTGNDFPYAVKVDSSDDIIVGGVCKSGSVQFMTIAKWNSSGTFQWQRRMYANSLNSSETSAYDMKLDTEDNIYVSGTTYYDSGLGNNPAARMIVLKIPSDGTLTGTYNSDVTGTVTLEASPYNTTTTQSAITVSTHTTGQYNFTSNNKQSQLNHTVLTNHINRTPFA